MKDIAGFWLGKSCYAMTIDRTFNLREATGAAAAATWY
jgi:hypothetical protein